MTYDRMLRAALVGCGEIARTHMRALSELDNVRICAVVDRDERRRRDLAAVLGGVPTFQESDAMLGEIRPDAVHVLTPPDSHAPLAIAAMEAGAHVLVEKPMALSTVEADAMIDCADRTGQVLATCHNMLFTPGMLRGRRLVDDGAIGDVVHVATYWGMAPDKGVYAGDPGTHWAWRMPGGVFTNFLPHTISLQREFLGGDMHIRDVLVTRRPPSAIAATDLMVVTQSSRGWGTMTITTSDRPAMRYVDVYGTKGLLRIDLAREICVYLPQRRVPSAVGKVLFGMGEAMQFGAGTVVSAAMAVSGRRRGNPGMASLVADFYGAIHGDRLPEVSGSDGRAVAHAMESIWARAESAFDPPLAPTVAPQPRAGVETRVSGDLAGRRVLVTGAGGFLGARVARALCRSGAKVAVVVRDRRRLAFDVEASTDVYEGDLLDANVLKEAARKASVVIHCAAATANAASWERHRRDTVLATEAVCQAAASAHVDRLVHVSSVIVYGIDHGLDGSVVDERMPVVDVVDPLAHYQRAKAEAERVVTDHQARQSLRTVILRPGVLYGPGRPLKGGIVQLGRWWIGIGRRHNAMPFTFVDNAVDAILLAAVVDEAVGDVFNIVDEPQRSAAELLSYEMTGTNHRFIAMPVWVANALAALAERRSARAGTGSPPRLSRFAVRSATRNIRYDTRSAHDLLGWESATAPAIAMGAVSVPINGREAGG